ncbi:MAG: GerMN domain-containing protein [Acidobacteriales bacterium]|nr:GerMN domain-containing protein [Terriglobales bacterium]
MIPRYAQITLALVLSGIFGVGFYMVHLKNEAQEAAVSSGSDRPLVAPISGPPQPVTLYIAYDGDGVMRQRSANAALPSEPSERAREVLRTLLAEYTQRNSSHPMAQGADVSAVFLVKNIAVVDLNRAFVEGHRSGVWVEALTISSFVATLAANNPAITRVKFLVEGNERETLAGHADLMALYEVSQINQLVRSLR